MTRPVLVVGLPRSGTTWVARVLGTAPGAVVVEEPDNEKTSPAAVAAKRRLGRFPVLDVGGGAGRVPGTSLQRYAALWAWALAGAPADARLRRAQRLLMGADFDALEARVSRGARHPRILAAAWLGRSLPSPREAGTATPVSPMPGGAATAGGSPGVGKVGLRAGDAAVRVVAKTVHGVLAAEWLVQRFDVDVVVVFRHPANVVASWLRMRLPDRDRRLDRVPAVQEGLVHPLGLPAPGDTALARVCWQAGLLTTALEVAVARHPEWHVVVHEELCRHPAGGFRPLFDAVGLQWGPATDARLAEDDRPGHEYATQRVAAELPEAWRSRLRPDELDAVRRVLPTFPLQRWRPEHFDPQLPPRPAPRLGEAWAAGRAAPAGQA